jgi:excisionase family DNA binding protein
MTGLGDFQRSQMKRVDQRVGELFSHLRSAIDILEDMMLHPYIRPTTEQTAQTIASPPPTTNEPMVVRVKDACRLLGCSAGTIYKLINAGEIESYLDGSARKFRVAAIREYIAKRIVATKKSHGA